MVKLFYDGYNGALLGTWLELEQYRPKTNAKDKESKMDKKVWVQGVYDMKSRHNLVLSLLTFIWICKYFPDGQRVRKYTMHKTICFEFVTPLLKNSTEALTIASLSG